MKRINSLKKIFSFVILLLVLFVSACSGKESGNEVINILYTTDVHCAIDDNIGYASLSAYKKELQKKYSKVTLIDCGDTIQGDYVGAVTKGKYIIEIMNSVGYDLMTLGNHEFDYGMDALQSRISEFKGDVLSCNVSYYGKGENKLSEVKPYRIIDYGTRKVAFIGVTTPTTLTNSTPGTFKEDGEYVYSFCEESYEKFYNTIQSNIDKCKEEGADYVILMAHLGYGDEFKGFGSMELVKNTKDVDVVLDGHSHKDIACEYIANLDGKYVPICGAGYRMNKFGRIMIAESGDLQVGLISRYDKVDRVVEVKIEEINSIVEKAGNIVLAKSDYALYTTDNEGVRMVRNRETAIGDMIADAYRYAGNAEIGFANGGGIREYLPSGDLTFNTIMKLNPFGNTIMTVKASGQTIIDYLEHVCRLVQKEYKVDGKAVGECGGFPAVSGIKFDIDTSVESSVVLDDKGSFASITGERRVKDVYVLVNGEYQPIELDRYYIVSSQNYLLVEGGDGANMFSGCEVVEKALMPDYEAIVRYIVYAMGGHLAEKYDEVDNRINIY